MATRWPPSKDAELATYVAAFSAKLTASPTTYGLVALDATQFATASTAYVNAYTVAVDPATRTKATVAQKDVAKANVLILLRSDAKRIQANPTVTAAAKLDLGLPIRDASPSPLPPPSTKPALTLTGIGRLSQVIRIADETTPDKKARPFGTSGAEIFAWLGEGDAPSDLRKWTFIGLATKGEYEIQWTDAEKGKSATLAGRWYNDKGETGPLSFPISAPIAA